MRIELRNITIKDVFDGYVDDEEEGVYGFGGKLNIRPKYQREFVYKDKQRDAVIETIQKNFPLNVMYWVKTDDGNYEVLDGQQRTISFCQYLNGDFSCNNLGFQNLPRDKQEQIMNYPLFIYVCEGNDSEKLEWFKTINIAGEKLTDQELRNAVYAGTWLTDAKRHFSKTGCAAYRLGGDYMTGSAIRQEYLETVLRWISSGAIEQYMSYHQHDENASEIWQYFQQVIAWTKMLFPTYRREMKTVQWGNLYNRYHQQHYDSQKLEQSVVELMLDEDVQKKSGIYEFLLSGDEKSLDLRGFDNKTKREAYERQHGICPICGKHFELEEMHADHIKPWIKGGKTTAENCQMLCHDDNWSKSSK